MLWDKLINTTFKMEGISKDSRQKNDTQRKEPRAVILKLFSLRIKRGSTDDRNVDRRLDFI